MEIRESVVSLSFIFPHPPEDFLNIKKVKGCYKIIPGIYVRSCMILHNCPRTYILLQNRLRTCSVNSCDTSRHAVTWLYISSHPLDCLQIVLYQHCCFWYSYLVLGYQVIPSGSKRKCNNVYLPPAIVFFVLIVW